MSLINIDLKSAGLDPAEIQQIEAGIIVSIKRVNWLLACAEAAVKSLAARFKFELPPDPNSQ